MFAFAPALLTANTVGIFKGVSNKLVPVELFYTGTIFYHDAAVDIPVTLATQSAVFYQDAVTDVPGSFGAATSTFYQEVTTDVPIVLDQHTSTIFSTQKVVDLNISLKTPDFLFTNTPYVNTLGFKFNNAGGFIGSQTMSFIARGPIAVTPAPTTPAPTPEPTPVPTPVPTPEP